MVYNFLFFPGKEKEDLGLSFFTFLGDFYTHFIQSSNDGFYDISRNVVRSLFRHTHSNRIQDGIKIEILDSRVESIEIVLNTGEGKAELVNESLFLLLVDSMLFVFPEQ